MKTLILLFFTLALFTACRNASDSRNDDNMRNTLDLNDNDGMGNGTGHDTLDTSNPAKNEFAEFSVTSGNMVLRPRDYESKIDFTGLGTPNDTLTRKLTLTTDTHQGSTVREYKYDNVNLTFFIPEGSNDAWLMTTEIKGGPWSTARGIRVGDSVDDLKKMYPNIATYTDKENIYAYNYTLDDATLLFGVDGDKISRIKIMYNIP